MSFAASLAVLAAAAAYTGGPVDVQCTWGSEWRPPEFEAYASLGAPNVWMRAADCVRLDELPDLKPEDAAWPVLLLGHELEHTLGVADEQEATCNAAHRSKRLAILLGYPRPFRVRRHAVAIANARLWPESRSCA